MDIYYNKKLIEKNNGKNNYQIKDIYNIILYEYILNKIKFNVNNIEKYINDIKNKINEEELDNIKNKIFEFYKYKYNKKN